MSRVRQVALAGLPAFDFALHEGPDPYISEQILEAGRYEPFETEIFRLAIASGDVVVDAGANIGWYSVIGALCTGATGKVFSFEPQRDNFGVLADNIVRNKLSWAHAEPLALADRDGEALLHVSDENLGDHQLFRGDETRPTEPVRTTTLDGYLGPRHAAPDVLKLDTQGSELRILAGAAAVLDQNRARGTAILLEYWPYGLQHSGSKPGALAMRLRELGGALFVIDERRERMHPVTPEALREQEQGQLHPDRKGFINLLRWPASRVLPAALQARIFNR